MKQLMGGLLCFVLGLAVGIAGSDDSLLKGAEQRVSMAYGRGYAAASAKLQAIAVQLGYAHWVYNPDTGEPDTFVWHASAQRETDPAEQIATPERPLR